MTQRWLDLFRTTSARLALLYAALFGLSVSVLFGLIYWAATAALSDRIDQDLVIQRDALTAEAGTAETPIVAAVANVLRRPHGEFRYQVQDAAGATLAGNLPLQQAWRAGYQDVKISAEYGHSDREPHLFRVLGQPLDQGAMLVVAQDAYALDELRELIVRAFAWGGAATLLLAGIGGGVMVSRVMHRVEVINRASERIMAGDLTGRLPVGMITAGGDEFDRLSINLNRMLDRIEKLVEGMRQVSTDIAHDLRTPLTRLRRSLERLRAGAQDASPAYVAGLDNALAQTDELLTTFASLLRIAQIESRATRFVFTRVDLSAIACTVLEVYRPAAEEKRQELEGEIPDAVIVAGDRALLTQMVANIVENAIRHAPEGASIRIVLQPGSAEGPLLTVSDNGPGIPSNERTNVFRRFYRLDISRGSPGNGLGLSLVAAIAELHGIAPRLSENTSQGLLVDLVFPKTETET
jgi:signal transduction histidine kinase